MIGKAIKPLACFCLPKETHCSEICSNNKKKKVKHNILRNIFTTVWHKERVGSSNRGFMLGAQTPWWKQLLFGS
jgi:hypothetical protein